MPSAQSNAADVVCRVKQEIDKLAKEQSKFLKDCVYVGMTLDEARKFYERRHQITKLIEELALLEKTQRGYAKGDGCECWHVNSQPSTTFSHHFHNIRLDIGFTILGEVW